MRAVAPGVFARTTEPPHALLTRVRFQPRERRSSLRSRSSTGISTGSVTMRAGVQGAVRRRDPEAVGVARLAPEVQRVGRRLVEQRPPLRLGLARAGAVARLAHLHAVVRHAAARSVLRTPGDQDGARAPVAACQPPARQLGVGRSEARLDGGRGVVARTAGCRAGRVRTEDQGVRTNRVRAVRLQPVDALLVERERGDAVAAGRRTVRRWRWRRAGRSACRSPGRSPAVRPSPFRARSAAAPRSSRRRQTPRRPRPPA